MKNRETIIFVFEDVINEIIKVERGNSSDFKCESG